MANLSELFTALERADAAGNADDARAIAAIIRKLQADQEPKRTVAGYAKEALKGIPRGLVGGLEQAALGAAALLPGDTESGLEQDVRSGIKGFADRLKPSIAPGYEEAIPTKLGEAVGSFGSLLLPAGVAGVVARGSNLARMAAVAPVAGAMGAGEARERAVQEGATPEQITRATQFGVVPGLAELVPVDRIFRTLSEPIKKGAFEYVKRAMATGGVEAAQEAASAVAQNLIAQGVYKPDQALIEGVGEQAAYGAGAGAIVQFLVDAVAGRRAKPVPPVQPQQEPEPQPQQDLYAAGVLAQPTAARTDAETALAQLQAARGQYEALPIDDPRRVAWAGNVAKQQSILDRIDAAKAKESAFGEELPDLFGLYYPRTEQTGAEPERPEFELTGAQQMELPLDEPAPAEAVASKVTDQTLLGLGFKPGVIKTAKFAKELKSLDLTKPGDVERFEELIENYANRTQAVRPFNSAAVGRFIDAAKFRQAKQTELPGFETQQEVANGSIRGGSGQAVGRTGVVAPVSQQTPGSGAVAGAERAGVDGAERAADGTDERAPEQSGALSDVEEVETAKEIAATTKSKKDFNDAITYLSYFKNSTDVGASAKIAATKALEELGVPDAEVQAAWENVAISEAAGQQERAESDAEAASKREQQNLAAQQRRAELAVKRGPRAPVKKPITAKERAQLASAEQRMVLKAPTDVAFQTPEDANNLLETYLSDVEKGDPKRRERTKFKAQVPAREFVDEADRAEVSKLMQAGEFDAAHTAIVRAVQRAVTAAKAAASTKFYMKEVAAAERVYRLSHRPVGSGLSQSVVQKLRKGDLKGALKEIGETGSTPVIRTAARKILSAIKGTKVLVRETPTGDAGIYSSTTDTIYIDPQGLHEHTLLHEAMHAAVSHVLANPNHPLTQKLQKLFEGLTPELRGQYGATNLQEFSAEAISNQEFQDMLRGQPKNWWGRFVDAVRGFLGMSKAKQVEKTLDQLLEAAPSEARSESVGILKLPATPAMEAYAPKRIAEKQREGDQPFFKRMMNIITDPKERERAATKFQVNVIYSGAAVTKKFSKEQGAKLTDREALESSTGLLMATRAGEMAATSILKGGIALDKKLGLLKVSPGVSIADVHAEVGKIAEKADVPFETAAAWFDLGATVLRMRSPEITPEIRKSMNISAQDQQAADDILQRYGTEIKTAIAKFQEYKNQLLKAGVETGRFTKEDVDQWMKAPEYVPWHRILDDARYGYETKSSTKQFIRGLVDSGKIAELIGGDVNERPIGDILGNMQNLSFWMVNTIVRNHAANQAMDGLLKIDAKRIPNPKAAPSDRVVKTYQKGEPTFFEVGDPLDKHAFDGIETLSTPLFKALGTAANWLRRGTTLMPGFVASQLFQDGFRATALSGVNNPSRIAAKTIASFGDAFLHRGTALDLEAVGIMGQPDYMVGADRDRVRAALDEGGGAAKTIMRHARGFLDAMTRASDAAQRIAIYEQTMKETKDELLAINRAMEIINFQKQGRSMTINVLRQIIPFMNAYIQGLDVSYRSMIGRGLSGMQRDAALRRFWGTGLKLAVLASLYTMLMGDDEEYNELPDYEKLTGWMIPGSRDMMKELTGVDMGGNLRVPAPQDPVGYMFKTLPEQTLGALLREGTKNEVDSRRLARILSEGVVNALSPPGAMPQLLKPSVEVATNYSFFTGNPIVGRAQQGLPKDLQFTSATSELSKLLSEFTPGLSPVQVEHLVRGYLGILGSTVSFAGGALIETATGMDKADRRLAQVPQFTTFLTGNRSAGAKEDYYELRERAMQVANAIREESVTNPENARRRLAENRELYALAKSGVFSQIEQQLRRIREARKLVETDKRLNSAAKRERLDQLDSYELTLLANINLPALRKFAGL